MSQLIYLTGNICTGKSTTAAELHKLTGWPVFSIDDFRIKHNALLITEEWTAWEDLIQQISQAKNAILETTGLPKSVLRIYGHFNNFKIVQITASLKVIEQRLEQRKANGYQWPPYCYNRDSSPLETAHRIQPQIHKFPHDILFDTEKLPPEEIAQRIMKTIHL